MDHGVIGVFVEEDLLMSEYAQRDKLFGKKAALVWVQKGRGQLVLSSFNPQFRSSTMVSYKLLFNVVLME